jgi:hypothetical protein
MAKEEKRLESDELEKGQQVETQETKENVIYDDKDPKEVLKSMAEQLNIDAEGYELLSKTELQSLIDQKITNAIKTREENLKKQQEEEKLKQEKQWEELLKRKESELLEVKKREMIRNAGLPVTLTKLVQGNSEEQIQESIEVLKSTLEEVTQEKLQSEIDNRLKGKKYEQGTKQPINISKEVLAKLSAEEINKLFENGELQEFLKKTK